MPDKLLETFEMRMTVVLKHNIKKLTPEEHKKMLEEVRDLMARHVHNCHAIFDPIVYQSESEIN
jgi:hypothetical protein